MSVTLLRECSRKSVKHYSAKVLRNFSVFLRGQDKNLNVLLLSQAVKMSVALLSHAERNKPMHYKPTLCPLNMYMFVYM